MQSVSKDKLIQTGMTPRAWRMIAYSCIGLFFYGVTIVMETLQNYNLNRIDTQMQRMDALENPLYDDPAVITSSNTVAVSSPAIPGVEPEPIP